jgi:hypothetical protein
MNFREFNQMNMFTAVNSVFQLSKDSIAKIKALEGATGRFNDKLADIASRDAQYSTAAAGATAAKRSASTVLTDTVLRSANALFVLGNKTGNEQLKAECRIYPSHLFLLRDLTLIRVSSRVAEFAKQYVSELGVYGIAEQDIGSLDAAIASFRKAREEQQQRFSEVTSVRGMLYEVIAEAANILRNEVDPLMELIKVNNIEFYNQYWVARKIRNLHARASKNEKTEATLVPPIPVSPPAPKLALAA